MTITILPESTLAKSAKARDIELANISHDHAKKLLTGIKPLHFASWQNTEICTTKQVAEFYEVPDCSVRHFVKARPTKGVNRKEFESDGLRVLRGEPARDVRSTLNLFDTPSQILVWTPRAVLRLGLFLKDSGTAQQVRACIPEVTTAYEQQSFEEKLERVFWSKVLVKQQNKCWEWQGPIEPSGYGVAYLKGKRFSAHRLSWLLSKGEIQEGLLVCHACDNRQCVNPDHLFLGSHADNMRDMAQKGRARRKSHSGVLSPNAKLSERQVQEIIRLSKEEGLSSGEIARRIGCSKAHVWRILTGKARNTHGR